MCQGGRAGQALHRWRGRDEPGTAQLVQGTGWAGCCSAMAQGGVGQAPCSPIWWGRPHILLVKAARQYSEAHSSGTPSCYDWSVCPGASGPNSGAMSVHLPVVCLSVA